MRCKRCRLRLEIAKNKLGECARVALESMQEAMAISSECKSKEQSLKPRKRRDRSRLRAEKSAPALGLACMFLLDLEIILFLEHLTLQL